MSDTKILSNNQEYLEGYAEGLKYANGSDLDVSTLEPSDAYGYKYQIIVTDKDDNADNRVISVGFTTEDIGDLAFRILGTKAKATEWLVTPSKALNGKKPTELLGSAKGKESVVAVLNKINYGDFS